MPKLDKDFRADLNYMVKQGCDRIDELEQENKYLQNENHHLKESVKILLHTNIMTPAQQNDTLKKLFSEYYGDKLTALLNELIIDLGFEPCDVLPMLSENLQKVS
jgi:hypothetical protein